MNRKSWQSPEKKGTSALEPGNDAKVRQAYMEATDWKVALCTAAIAILVGSEKLTASMGVGPR
jgi:hypothetical protein